MQMLNIRKGFVSEMHKKLNDKFEGRKKIK